MISKLRKIVLGGFLLGSVTSASAITLVADDFDGNTVAGGVSASGGIDFTTGAGPAGSNGNVGIVSMNAGGEWQSMHGANILLPPEAIPGTDTITFSYRVYIPSPGSSGTATAGDQVNSLFRWNGATPDAYPPSVQHNITTDIAYDTWVVFNDSGDLPLVDGTPAADPLTSVTPIWSFRNAGNEAGMFAYIDDFEVSVTPEPSTSFLASLCILSGILRRRRS